LGSGRQNATEGRILPNNYLRNLNRNVSIAIIGAGFSGLAAFERLHYAGFKQIDLFEASDRIGGRVYPIPFGEFFSFC
jgi:tryptophan 2-monooxygenase